MRTFRLIPVLSIVSFAALPAQTPVDQGNFTITRGGVPYGSESFLIMRQAGGEDAAFTLTSTRIIGGRVIRSSLKTDSAGGPITYLRQEGGASGTTIVASGKTVGRLTVNVSGPSGRSSKDYLVVPGTLLVDDDLMHQLYFVCLDDRARTIPYVAPEAKTSASGAVVSLGADVVEFGNKATAPGRHFAFGSGPARREIWIDSTGRLLKVSYPGRQIDGIRDEPPR